MRLERAIGEAPLTVTTAPAESLLDHFECGVCGARADADGFQSVCGQCGRPLFARYDLAAARAHVDRDALAMRPRGLWRWAELLPVRDPARRIALGEGDTPLRAARRLGETLGLRSLWIKDESLNPTGSFKARGMAVAVSRAHELGARVLSVPSAGNAAGALAAYAAAAGVEARVFMPRDVPPAFVVECRALGARVTLVDGLITDCGRVAAEQARESGAFDVSTLREPCRLEGKKTMGYEIAEAFGWTLPDVIVYPTGGGTGLVGMWKAFDELERLGWIDGHRPRMVSVQATGCAPIVRAFERGDEAASPWTDARTIADGLRVPRAIGDVLVLEALRRSQGAAVAVDDAAMLDGVRRLGRTEGIFAAPEGGATVAALERLLASGVVRRDERVVLFNTGGGHKYASRMAGGWMP